MVTTDTDGVLRIVVSTNTNACSDAGATPPIDRKNEKLTQIELADVSGAGTSAPTAPGTYTIYPNSGSRPAKSAGFVVETLDGACTPDDATLAQGQSGTVTLAALGTEWKGSYDVVLNTGDHASGTFTATSCPALQAAADASAHSCM